MDPQPSQTSAAPNPLLAHLNDTDEAHASTRVDFAHPGTMFHPEPKAAEPEASAAVPAAPAPAPAVPVEPAPEPVLAKKTPEAEPPVAPPADTPPPTPTAAPPAPKSPRNKRPIVLILIVLLLLAAAGGGAYYWFKVRPANNQSNNQSTGQTPSQTTQVETGTPAGLAQKGADGKTLAAGGTTKNPIELDFSLSTTANSGTLTPQVEVQPIGTPFTGQSNYHGDDVGPSGGNVAGVISVKDLKDGGYHWQARFMAGTTAGDWTAYAASGVTTADFTIDSTAPTAAAITGVGSKTVKSGTTNASTTDSNPTFKGTAEAGSTIALAIAPDNQTASATSDAKGGWSASSSTPLANGDHTITITTTDLAGNTSTSSFTLSVNTATAAPATTTVAPTGDNTKWLTLLGFTLMIVCSGGLILATRYGRSQV